jgi:hypothetical protein
VAHLIQNGIQRNWLAISILAFDIRLIGIWIPVISLALGISLGHSVKKLL